MTEESSPPKPEVSYPFFAFSNADHLAPSFGFFDAPQKSLPPPPCIEVPLFEPEDLPIKLHIESIVVGDGQHRLTFLKGRVSASDIFGVSNADLVPGKYEGGLKLWEGSLDLVKTLHTEIEKGQLTVKGKRVLELGCGHGLPGIFAALKGALTVHFQDFNAEVLRFLTIPNVKANILKNLSQCHRCHDHQQQQSSLNSAEWGPVPPCHPLGKNAEADLLSTVRFFAGDWSEVHHLLLGFNNGHPQNEEDSCVNAGAYDGYDIVLMAETVYAPSSLQNLYELIKKCLRRPKGVVYIAGKKHYFGVGGGTRQFINLVELDRQMKTLLLAEFADGSSNVREVWKLSFE